VLCSFSLLCSAHLLDVAEYGRSSPAPSAFSVETGKPFRSWRSLRLFSSQMLVWSSMSSRPLYCPRVSLPRLRLIWRRPSCKQPQAWLIFETIFLLISSTLKVSWALVCLLALMLLYRATSRLVAWLGTFPQERQKLWLPKDDLRDSSSWVSPPLVLLRDIHSKLLTQYDCKEEVCAQSQSQVNVGAGAGPGSQSQAHIGDGPSPVNAGAGARLSSQDGVPQQQELCLQC
jgi:hypothetical protein